MDKQIRRQVGEIFGVLITKDEWDSSFEQLDRENRLNSKNINKVLLLILKRLEEMEEVAPTTNEE